MSVSFPGSDVLTSAAPSSSIPGFDVLFPTTPAASSTASSAPTTTPSATSTPSPVDTYEPTPATGTAASVNNPVDLAQPGTTLADGSTVAGDPTGLSSDQIQPSSSTDPYWATDAPSSDFDTPVPGFGILFTSGTEENAASNIQNAAAATPTTYQALDGQIQAASSSELLASLGGSGSTSTSDQASGSNPLGGVSSLLAAISQGYNSGVYGGGNGSAIDTTA